MDNNNLMDKLGNSKDVDVLVFGTYKFSLNVVQKPNGVFYEKDSKDNNTINVPMFKGVFTQPKLHVDLLGMKNKYYEVTYNDYLSNLQTQYKGSLMDISKDLISEVFYLQKREDISKFLPSFFETSISKEQLDIVNYYSIVGYFLHNSKVINNNVPLWNKYYNLPLEELTSLVQEQCSRYNEYLAHLGVTYTEIAKLILLMPFYYLFKQVSYQDAIKYILLYGKAKAHKTSACNTLLSSWGLDNDRPTVMSCAGTFASLRNEFNNYCTLPMLIDEARDFFKDPKVQELLKDLGYNIDGRGTANLDKQGENLQFKGFHHYVFTTNQASNVFEGLSRRLISYNFEESVTNDNFDYSNLDFSAFYWVFSCALCEFINAKGVAVLKQYAPNELIDLILMKVEDTFDVDLSLLQGVNPYTDINTDLDYEAVETVCDNLQKDYNVYCKNTGNNDTSISGLVDYNPSYKDWKHSNGWFWINENKLKRFILKKSQKNTVTLKELFSFRGYSVEIHEINSINELNMDNETDPLVYYYTGGNTKLNYVNLNTKNFILSARALEVLFNR